MALIASVGLFVLSILGAALSRLAVSELEAWGPLVIRTLIKLAVARLPEKLRERYGEEWQGHVDETPGLVCKIALAAGCVLAARKMARIERHTSEVEGWRRRIVQLEELQSLMRTTANAVNATHNFIHDVAKRAPNGESLASNVATIASNAATMNVLVRRLKELTERLTELVSADPPTYLGKLLNQLQRRIVLQQIGVATPAEASRVLDGLHEMLKKAVKTSHKLRTHARPARPA
jgi:hypothetical protein